MNSEEQTITKVDTKERVKNPKRVAQGKRLAAISRETKENKKALKLAEQQAEENSFPQLPDLTTSISLIGIATGVIGTYFAWKHFKREEVNTSNSEPLLESTATSSNVKYNNLDNDDI